MTTLMKERKTWAMGIISRIPIKDFKSKLLGGKYRQKVEPDVPAIDVTPPTPISKTFTFASPAEAEGQSITVEHETTTELKRCRSEPDLIGGKISRAVIKIKDASPINIVSDNNSPKDLGLSRSLPIVGSDKFLQIPRGRRRRRRSKRGSQSNHIDEFNLKWLKDNGLIDCKVIELSRKEGCGAERYNGHEVDSKNGGNATKKSADINQNMRTSIHYSGFETLTDKISSESNHEIQHVGLNSVKYKHSKMGVEKTKPNEDNFKTEDSEIDGRFQKETMAETICENTIIESFDSNKIQQENVVQSVKTMVEEDSMDHEDHDEFEIDSSSENLLDISLDTELSCTQEKDKDTQISTWSLNLDSNSVVATFKRGHQRTQSDTNFLTDTQKENWSDGFDNGAGMVATRSLDLDVVASSDDITGREVERTQSETTLETNALKQDNNYYMGRLNGIISKFSTWSLDMDILRKRSMDYLVVERAFSETTLGPELDKKRRCWSYHTLLYDVDFASRYQIYQPTVENITEQTGAEANSIEYQQAAAGLRKQYTPGKRSMKELKRQCSEQIGSIYDNGKHIYNNRASYVAAFKERTRSASIKEKVKNDIEIDEKPVFTPRKAITLPSGNQR